MLMAQLRGKLPSEIWLGSEDLLTSAVFGTLKYLPWTIVANLLSRAVPLEGSTRIALAERLEWHFWPWWGSCEPDVVIEDTQTLCVVEAKLYADFGESELVGNQLDRQWRDGSRLAQETEKELWLLAVTNHTTPPAGTLYRQLARSDADYRRVCWLSWLTIAQFLHQNRECVAAEIFDDLMELLSRMGLAPFLGFGAALETATSLPRLAPTLWQFSTKLETDVLGFGRALTEASYWARRGSRLWTPNLV
jgi:hypothetical protein